MVDFIRPETARSGGDANLARNRRTFEAVEAP